MIKIFKIKKGWFNNEKNCSIFISFNKYGLKEIFPGDFRCRFIIKQVLLRSFHEDHKNTEMMDAFNSSLTTYGRIIQEEGLFLNEKDPVEVTTQYYAKYCTIPEEKWLDSFESPALSKYFNSIKEKYPRK